LFDGLRTISQVDREGKTPCGYSMTIICHPVAMFGLLDASRSGIRMHWYLTLRSQPHIIQTQLQYTSWARSEDTCIFGNVVPADAQGSTLWSRHVQNAVFPDAHTAIQRKCNCGRIYIVMGHIQMLGLPRWAGSNLVALLGSVCKAGDVENRCRAKR